MSFNFKSALCSIFVNVCCDVTILAHRTFISIDWANVLVQVLLNISLQIQTHINGFSNIGRIMRFTMFLNFLTRISSVAVSIIIRLIVRLCAFSFILTILRIILLLLHFSLITPLRYCWRFGIARLVVVQYLLVFCLLVLVRS